MESSTRAKSTELLRLRNWIIGALAFLLCSFAFSTLVIRQYHGFHLTLEISSSVSSPAQLFYDSGSGYNEADSRTERLFSSPPGEFRKLSFRLPAANISRLRFDPSTTPGTFVLRKVEILDRQKLLLQIPISDIAGFNQTQSREQVGDTVAFSTAPGANDAGLTFRLNRTLSLHGVALRDNLRLLVIGNATLLGLALIGVLAGGRIDRISQTLRFNFGRIDSFFAQIAARLSTPDFIRFDSYAIWFYSACLLFFLVASLADLNGSSIGMYPAVYGHGEMDKAILGAPRAIRSDEWGYVTPDILNQYQRSDRFEVMDSELGGHSVSLMGNIPVRHFSTVFRPQFWSFFVLPLDYAYSVYWQFKALILVTGLFSFLLLITGTTFWAAFGSLWYFFSPFTQWTYSWPSALPEMVGLICFAVVFACYLTVGRNIIALAVAALGLTFSAINFALCAYLPHMIPLWWLAVFVFVSWIVARHKSILTRASAGPRIIAAVGALCAIGITGALVFYDVHRALAVIAATVYPGSRVRGGGTATVTLFVSHFMQWTETEGKFSRVLGNISEGSGFLWLAPVTLLWARRMSLSKFQKAAFIALWAAFLLVLAWSLLPLPVAFGRIFGLDRTWGPRCLPALGVANIAIVSLCMAALRGVRPLRIRGWQIAAGGLLFAALFLVLRLTNQQLGSFVSSKGVLFAAFFTALLIFLMTTARKVSFAFLLVASLVLADGAVNPVQRGLDVVASSKLNEFVRTHPQLLQGKWLVFSDSPVASGFFAATGCDVYTGTHYLPDIDHFAQFAADGLDLDVLNRLGFLDAHLRKPDSKEKLELISPVVVQWNVSPLDPIIRRIGIRYVAFDQQPPVSISSHLTELSAKPIDGYWLYALP